MGGCTLVGLFIQAGSKLEDFGLSEKQEVYHELQRFAEQHATYVNQGNFQVYLKPDKGKLRHKAKIQAQVKLTSDKGLFVGKGKAFGYKQSVHQALTKVGTQLSKRKEIQKNHHVKSSS